MENNINKNLPIPTKSKLREFVESGWDLIKFALIALAIVIPIRMWVAQPFVVSGESMFPTFDNGQYLIVDEISYILGHEQRGDVVIFRYPGDTKRFFIKRLIGLPNETIVVTDKDVTIINKAHPEGFKLNEPYVSHLYRQEHTKQAKVNTLSWEIIETEVLIREHGQNLLH